MKRNQSASEAISYRVQLEVTTVHRFVELSVPAAYPVCPRCQHTMEREYQAFCDRCGQALSWKNFGKVAVVIR